MAYFVEEIEGLLFDWLVLNTGFDGQNVIRANQSGNRPTGDYCTFQVISELPSESNLVERVATEDDLDVIATYANLETVTASITIYSKNGRQLLRALNNSRYKLETRLIFKDKNVVLSGASGTYRDLSETGDTGFRAIHQQDFDFRNWSESSEQYEQIKEFTIDGEFEK